MQYPVAFHAQNIIAITILELFIAEIRSRMNTRLWRLLINNLTEEQIEKLNNLLIVKNKKRQSLFISLA